MLTFLVAVVSGARPSGRATLLLDAAYVVRHTGDMAGNAPQSAEDKDREVLVLAQALHSLAEAAREALNSGDTTQAARKIEAIRSITDERISDADLDPIETLILRDDADNLIHLATWHL